MTINNNNINPFPTANSYTSRLYGNNNCCWNNKAFVHCSQSQKVPFAKPFSENDKQYWDNVTVPNGEVIPMGCEGNVNMMPQFNKDLFQCSDGTVLNIKTHKVVSSVEQKNGYWGNGKLNNPYERERESEWNDRQIVDSMIRGEDSIGMDSKDREYNEFLKHKDNELKNNMNDLQKKLLSDVENGLINSKTRLKEVI